MSRILQHPIPVNPTGLSSLTHTSSPLAFLGAGKMAEAMIDRPLSSDYLPQMIKASHPREDRRRYLSSRYGIQVYAGSQPLLTSDWLILSIKPQVRQDVFTELHGRLRPQTSVLSIMAGVSLPELQVGLRHSQVVRAMPNLPAQIGQGMTVWTASQSVKSAQLQEVTHLLSYFGRALYLEKEEGLNLATALSGTGPSYLFLLLESMIETGVRLGLTREQARELCQQTLRGASQYAQEKGIDPALMRHKVTSPGGTSAAALRELERGGFRTVIDQAIEAAYRRSREL